MSNEDKIKLAYYVFGPDSILNLHVSGQNMIKVEGEKEKLFIFEADLYSDGNCLYYIGLYSDLLTIVINDKELYKTGTTLTGDSKIIEILKLSGKFRFPEVIATLYQIAYDKDSTVMDICSLANFNYQIIKYQELKQIDNEAKMTQTQMTVNINQAMNTSDGVVMVSPKTYTSFLQLQETTYYTSLIIAILASILIDRDQLGEFLSRQLFSMTKSKYVLTYLKKINFRLYYTTCYREDFRAELLTEKITKEQNNAWPLNYLSFDPTLNIPTWLVDFVTKFDDSLTSEKFSSII